MAVQEFTTEELESEEWRKCVGLGMYGGYQISNLGRLRYVLRSGRHRIRKVTQRGKGGYLFASVSIGGGKLTMVYIHRLVMLAFVGPVPEGKEVNHIDSNRGNPRLSNLEYVTHLENMAHAKRAGRLTGNRGTQKPRKPRTQGVKLTASDVIAIRRGLLSGATCDQLASQFGVTQVNISAIKTDKIWTHVAELRDEVKTKIGVPWKTVKRHRRTEYA